MRQQCARWQSDHAYMYNFLSGYVQRALEKLSRMAHSDAATRYVSSLQHMIADWFDKHDHAILLQRLVTVVFAHGALGLVSLAHWLCSLLI